MFYNIINNLLTFQNDCANILPRGEKMLKDKKQELGNILKNNFNIVFTNLVKETCGNNLQDEKQTYTKLAQELGITYQALINYKKDRMPEYKQLAFIKDYFDVSYSYLLGETKKKKLNSTGFNFDLSGSALDKLEEISNQSKNGNYSCSGMTYIIENLLLEKDNKTLKLLAYLLIANVVESDKQKIDYIKFSLLNKIIEDINIMSKELDLPEEILLKAYESLKNEIN